MGLLPLHDSAKKTAKVIIKSHQSEALDWWILDTLTTERRLALKTKALDDGDMPGPLFLFPSPRGPRFKQPKLYSIWQENKEPALAKFTSLKKKKKTTCNP